MDKQQRDIIRGMATIQINQLDLLVQAIDTSDMLQKQLTDTRNLLQQYTLDMEEARARIFEDEATIQIKDNQLNAAESQLKDEKLHNEALKLENTRKLDTLKTLEDVIAELKKELKAYQDNEPLPVLEFPTEPAGFAKA